MGCEKSGGKDESVAAKEAQVIGEGSGGMGEGSVEGKNGHVPLKESSEARKGAYVSEKGEGSVGEGVGEGVGDGSEGALKAREGREVSMGGRTTHN